MEYSTNTTTTTNTTNTINTTNTTASFKQSKQSIINSVHSNPQKKLELSNFLSAGVKSVRAKIVLGAISKEFSADGISYRIYFDNQNIIETVLSMQIYRKKTRLVCRDGYIWAGWNQKEGVYLSYDSDIINNGNCMKIVEITGFEDVEEEQADDILRCELVTTDDKYYRYRDMSRLLKPNPIRIYHIRKNKIYEEIDREEIYVMDL